MSKWKEYKLGEITKHNILGDIPNSWLIVKFESVVELIHGYQFRTNDFTENGIKVFKITQIKGDGIIDIENCDFIAVKRLESFKKNILNYNDILMALTGATIGKIARFKSNEVCLQNYRVGKFISRDKMMLSEDYLYYFLSSKLFYHQLLARQTQSAQQNIGKEDINNMSICFPSLPTQTTIAEILSSLDDKIELNNQINKDLEALAQALFKQWFIDFEFPNENGEPYRSSGGEMVESEFGRIPQGWKIDLLNTVFDFLEGPGLRNWQYTNEGMPFINIRLIQNGDINTEKSSYISKQEFETKYRHFELHEFDFVVSTSGTLGKSAIVRTKHLPLMLNTSVIRFKPLKQNSKCFMYQYLQSESFLEELRTQASGSVQLNFGPMHLNRINMIIPAESVIQNYEELFDNVYQKIISNREENNSLATLRDTLLPKLISGELEISDIQTKTL